MKHEIIVWLYTLHILYFFFFLANISTALNHVQTEHSPVERIWTIQKSKRSLYKIKEISWLLNCARISDIAHLIPAYFRINNYNCVEFQRMRNKLIHLNLTKCWQQYGKERRPHFGNDYKTLKANSYLKCALGIEILLFSIAIFFSSMDDTFECIFNDVIHAHRPHQLYTTKWRWKRKSV